MSLLAVSCLYCNAKVYLTHDYKNHLNFVHKLFKNVDVDECIELTLKKVENEKKNIAIEEVTLGDDDDEEHKTINKKVNSGDDFVDKSEIEKIAKETCGKLFSNLRSFMQESNIKSIQTRFEEKDLTDLCKNEESITQYFSKLKEKVRKTEIPNELVDQFRNCGLKQEKPDDLTNMKRDENTFLGRKEVNMSIQMPKLSQKEQAHKEAHSEEAKGEVTFNEQSKHIFTKSTPKYPTLPLQSKSEKRFLCPLPSCSFWTDKVGMKGGKAAVHLSKDHGIKPKDMQPGQFRFNKVNVVT